ncbi:MAG: hypothetical protein ACMVO3_15605 [Thalassobaculum sp.]
MASSLTRRLVIGAILTFLGLNFLGALGLYWLQAPCPRPTARSSAFPASPPPP